MPDTIDETMKLDKETGTSYWLKAKVKAMKSDMVGFKINDEDKVPGGHEEILAHMIFDVKISLERNARLVANRHRKVGEVPREMTYSSVPSRDLCLLVRLFFLVSALHDLDVSTADIQNAHLSAPINNEKYFIWARAEDRFLPQYGLKSIKSLGFTPCKADPDVYMPPAVHIDGDPYNKYMVCYVDDILVCSEKLDIITKAIEGRFRLKDGTVDVPTFYLSENISIFLIESTDDPN